MGLLERLFGKNAKKDGFNVEVAEASKREGSGAPCGCGGSREGDGVIIVMGPGCKKCRQLHENALAASRRLSRPVRVDYVTDSAAVADAGVMATPALFVYGKMVSHGKVLSTEDIVGLFQEKALKPVGAETRCLGGDSQEEAI